MTIAQVSQKYGVSADTLRYYERIGEMQAVLDRLDKKIEGYESHLLKAERSLKR